MYLSVTKIKTFETCQLKFKWQYIDKIAKPQPTTVDTIFGKYLHRFVELYPKKTVPELVQLLDEEIGRPPDINDQLINSITNTVDFLKRYEDYIGESEAKLDSYHKKIKLGGKVDKIFTHGDQIVVIDFKTSKKFHKGYNDLQLKFYSLLISQIRKIPPEHIDSIIYYSRLNKLENRSFTEEDLEYLKNYIEDVADRMKSVNTYAPKKNLLCDYCVYKEDCPLWR